MTTNHAHQIYFHTPATTYPILSTSEKYTQVVNDASPCLSIKVIVFLVFG